MIKNNRLGFAEICRLLSYDDKTGFKGIANNHSRWSARITVNRQAIHLGTYDTKEQAHAAYCSAATKYFGEYANYGEKP